MEMRFSSFMKMLVLSSFLVLPGMVEAATSAGEIARITGDSIAQARATDGSMRKLAEGAAIYSGDAISTRKDPTLDILFADGSRFAVGPQAEFVVDRFVYRHG